MKLTYDITNEPHNGCPDPDDLAHVLSVVV